MNDNDIIKALKCCGCLANVCDDCPIASKLKEDCKCGEYLAINALSLINSQKAEIERLQKQLVFEIESAYDRGAKAAIKEFAERLCEGRVSNDPVVIAVKVELEMVGDVDD